MRALGFVATRIGHAVLLVVAVVVLNFLLIHLAPGDPADVIAGEMGGADPEILRQLRIAYGLDKSLAEQLWRYVARVLSGDLGQSYYFNAPVTDLILQRLPATLLLVVTAVLAAMLVGTLLGVIAARRPTGWLSHVISALSVVGYSAPVFWTGILLILLFASVIPVLPVAGMRDVARAGGGRLGDALDVLRHLLLPATTLAIVYLAQYSRLARASMLEVLGADYIRTARAKGLPEHVVVFKHALRNAVLPVITVAGLQFGQVMAGAVLVETVFAWPGLGRLAYESILRRDSPTLLGILLFSALVVIAANVVTDLAYRLVDPRIGTAS